MNYNLEDEMCFLFDIKKEIFKLPLKKQIICFMYMKGYKDYQIARELSELSLSRGRVTQIIKEVKKELGKL